MSLELMKEYRSTVGKKVVSTVPETSIDIKDAGLDLYNKQKVLQENPDIESSFSEARKLKRSIKDKIKHTRNPETKDKLKFLLDKFEKEYSDLDKAFEKAIENDKKISESERFSIMLELGDIIKLADKNGIDEKNALFSKVYGAIRGLNAKKAENNARSTIDKIMSKDINDYDKKEATAVLDYLDKNFREKRQTPEVNVNHDVKNGFTAVDSIFNQVSTNSSPVIISPSSEINPWDNYGLTSNFSISQRKIHASDYIRNKRITQQIHNDNNSTESLSCEGNTDYFSDIKQSIVETVYSSDKLSDVINGGDETNRNLFQEKAIKKVLGLGNEIDLDEHGFNEKYVVSYSHERGNYLLTIEEFENELANKKIEQIDSRGLANYIKYLKNNNNGNLSAEILATKFNGERLMELGQLWSGKGKNDKYTGIAKNAILKENPNGAEIIKTILKFKSIESINAEIVRNLKSNDENNENNVFFTFLNKNKEMFLKQYNEIIDQNRKNLKKGKTPEEIKQIDYVFEKIHDFTKEEIKKSPIDIKNIVTKSISILKGLDKKSFEQVENDPLFKDVIKNAIELGKSEVLNRISEIKKDLDKANKEVKDAEYNYFQTGKVGETCTIDDSTLTIDELDKKYEADYKEGVNYNLTREKQRELEKELSAAFREYFSVNLEAAQIKLLIENGSLFEADSNEKLEKLLKEQEQKRTEKIQNGEELTESERNILEAKQQYTNQVNEDLEAGNITKEEAKSIFSNIGYSPEEINKYLNNESSESKEKNNSNENSDEQTQTNLDNNENNFNSRIISDKISIKTNLEGESFISLKTDSAEEYPITKEESELIDKNEKYKDNFSNFLETVSELGLKDFWEYRTDIFKTVDNLIGGTAFKEDSEKLNKTDLNRFLSVIVKSCGIEPKNRTIDQIKNQVHEINFGSKTSNDQIVNSKGNGVLFENFKQNFIKEGKFDQISFEKSLLTNNGVQENTQNNLQTA